MQDKLLEVVIKYSNHHKTVTVTKSDIAITKETAKTYKIGDNTLFINTLNKARFGEKGYFIDRWCSDYIIVTTNEKHLEEAYQEVQDILYKEYKGLINKADKLNEISIKLSEVLNEHQNKIK